MSYTLISERTQRAAKPYRCIWCGESITRGEAHTYEVARADGDLQRHRWHHECWDDSRAWFQESGEDEFSPFDNPRPPTAASLEFDSWDCALLKQAALV